MWFIPRIICIPETDYVIVQLEDSDEAHQGDIVTYFIDIKWSTDMLVKEYNVLFKHLWDDGLWVWLNKTELLNDQQVTESEKQFL